MSDFRHCDGPGCENRVQIHGPRHNPYNWRTLVEDQGADKHFCSREHEATWLKAHG